MPTVINKFNRIGLILYESACFAGVDSSEDYDYEN